jgi:hypothetical protein
MRKRQQWESQFLSQKPHEVHGKPLSNYITHDGYKLMTKTVKLEYPKQVIRVSDVFQVPDNNLRFFATRFQVRFWDDYTELILPALEAFQLSLQVLTGPNGPNSDRVKIGKTVFSKTSLAMALISRYVITTALTAQVSRPPLNLTHDGLALGTGENLKIVNRPLILGRPEPHDEFPWEDTLNPQYWDSLGNSRSGREDEMDPG